MNLREGTRRLALLLGVLGAIAGGFASYVELQTTLEQRTRHNKFEQLAAVDVVQLEHKCRLAGMGSGCSNDPYAGIAMPTKEKSVIPLPEYDAAGNPIQGWEEPSQVDKGGIKAIRWAENYGVESIETQEGETLYSTPAPSAWLYLLIAFLPLLGFFIPWGAVRAIGWVGAGFLAKSA